MASEFLFVRDAQPATGISRRLDWGSTQHFLVKLVNLQFKLHVLRRCVHSVSGRFFVLSICRDSVPERLRAAVVHVAS